MHLFSVKRQHRCQSVWKKTYRWKVKDSWKTAPISITFTSYSPSSPMTAVNENHNDECSDIYHRLIKLNFHCLFFPLESFTILSTLPREFYFRIWTVSQRTSFNYSQINWIGMDFLLPHTAVKFQRASLFFIPDQLITQNLAKWFLFIDLQWFLFLIWSV